MSYHESLRNDGGWQLCAGSQTGSLGKLRHTRRYPAHSHHKQTRNTEALQFGVAIMHQVNCTDCDARSLNVSATPKAYPPHFRATTDATCQKHPLQTPRL
ncbi:hypothetical protein EMIT0P2_20067 [Pseudomonas sp. IT-P2]